MTTEPGLLVFRIDDRRCALPLEHVSEVMRPLVCEPVPDTPVWVSGVSIIRGQPAPVIDLGLLLWEQPIASPARLVALEVDRDRVVALKVSEVFGVVRDDQLELAPVPPLLKTDQTTQVSALGRLDQELVRVLSVGRLVPDSVWAQLVEQAQ